MKAILIFITVFSLIIAFSFQKDTPQKTKTPPQYKLDLVAAKQTNAPPFVRRNFYSLSPQQIESYRRGIAVMKSKPSSDPTSFTFQANIHGYNGEASNPNWAKCQHSSFFFSSWHRMYLYFFERIVRKSSGDPTLTLPYWNYSDNREQAAMPLAFRQPADASNSLFEAKRSPLANGGFRLPPSATSYLTTFEAKEFYTPEGNPESFGGQQVSQPVSDGDVHGMLESQPHDIVHVLIGGQYGLMTNTAISANDPVFWNHHCHTDRLISQWLALGQGRKMGTDDPIWMNMMFSFFDENGQQVHLSGKEIIDSANQLGYVYDDEATWQRGTQTTTPPPVASTQKIDVLTLPLDKTLTTNREKIVLVNNPSQTQQILNFFTQNQTRSQFSVFLDCVTYREVPSGTFEVYLNLPDGEVANYKNKYYIGNLPLFGMGDASTKTKIPTCNASPGGNVALGLTRVLRQLQNPQKLELVIVRRGWMSPDDRVEQAANGLVSIKQARIREFRK